MTKPLYLLLSLIISLSINSKTLEGKIIRVSDGDTVILLDKNNTSHKIRLDGIDAPESKQAYGAKATKHLESLIKGKYVTVEWAKKDQYKRILGTIYYKNKNINEEMVKSGYAWQYKYNRSKNLQYFQQDAKRAKRGLWKDSNPIDPWQWRKANK